jgi:uncharacterized protein (TIGR02246 family)
MSDRPILFRLMRRVVAMAASAISFSFLVEAGQAKTNDAFSELHARVEAYERAWNTHQASAVATFFTQDADMIFGNGPRIAGREAIQQWWAGYFAKIAAIRGATFAIGSLQLITSDVALLNVDSTTAGRDSTDQELPPRLARGTWVMVRRSGDWWISALRGLPAQGDVRVSPGTDR